MPSALVWDKSSTAPRNIYPGQNKVRTDNEWRYQDLVEQIDKARVNGLLNASYGPANTCGQAVTRGLAIYSRESNMDLTARGDRGEAFGPAQVHPAAGVDGTLFFQPEYTANYVFKSLSSMEVRLRAAFPNLDSDTLEQVLFSCWNRGLRGEEENFEDSADPSKGTAYDDYGLDTWYRRQALDDILGTGIVGGPDPQPSTKS
jgi:hypothetical protein